MPDDNFINITPIGIDFEHFLNIEDNKRIFFSGNFGIGKTFFLQKFFEDKKDNYDFFHLYPTNYQISSNENIIELIKYDLLTELLRKDNDLLDNNPDGSISESAMLFFSFIRSNYSSNQVLQSVVTGGEFLSGLSPDPTINLLGKLGKPLKYILELDKKFQEFKRKYQTDGEDKIQEYIAEMQKKNISEDDYMSHFISDRISNTKGDKKSVLILDDLDRVDPEHIFRILNIFSAHFDEIKNKFGFDVVILVGDLKNIKSIFHHRFGPQTDFNGYVNKFFSVKPFYFDNHQLILEKLRPLITQIKCREDDLHGAFGESGYIQIFLFEILSRFLDNHSLNLRQLYKPINFHLPELKKGVYQKNAHFVDQFQKIVDISITLLIAILDGDKIYLISTLTEIRNKINRKNVGRETFYPKYIYSMLKGIAGKETLKGVGQYSHKNHMIDIHGEEASIGSDQLKTVQCFYDILIDYIEKGIYIKKNYSDYDD